MSNIFRISRPFLIVAAAVGILSFFPLARPSSFHIREAKSPLFESFPEEIGEWKGSDSLVDERTFEILETRNVLSRTYENKAGQRIDLLLVASRKDRRVAHPPEVCYLSSNYQIVQERESLLEDHGLQIPIKEFIAKHERLPEDVQSVLYLYKIGENLTTNYYAQQLRFAWDRLARKTSEVYLIRLAGLAGVERERLHQFLLELLPHLKTS